MSFKIGTEFEWSDNSRSKIVNEDNGWFTLENIKEGSTPSEQTNGRLGVKSFCNEHSLNLAIEQGMIVNVI